MLLTSYSKSKVRRTKVLVYGPPKSGKTAFVGKLAEAGYKLHWIDLESGVKTLLNPKMLAPSALENISLFNFPDRRDLPVGIDGVRRMLKPGLSKFCFTHGIHACPSCKNAPSAQWSEEFDISKLGDKDILVLDSSSQLTNSALSKVTKKAWEKDDEYKPTFDDWRLQGMYLDEIFSKIQAYPINAVVISHELDIEKDEKKEKMVPLGGTRNFSATFAKYFDEVIYLSILNKSHRANNSTTWDPTRLTGGRTGVILDGSKEFSLADIFSGEVPATPTTPSK